jgi:lipoate-protein ligase A
MAVDEALLTAAIDGGLAALRLYQWSEPTLSLGYFQRVDDRRCHAASRDCAVVRRSSGGGAILHDRELTYSLAIPACHPLSRDAPQLYSLVHGAMAQLLASRLLPDESSWTLQSHPASDPISRRISRRSDEEPFLCFARRLPTDVLLVARHATRETLESREDWKILGSAQRRRGGAILQHGSLLLERSTAAPELPGWLDLTHIPLPLVQLVEEFPRRLSAQIGAKLERSTFPVAVGAAACEIEQTKFKSQDWTRKR